MRTKQYLESFVKQGDHCHSSMIYEVEGKKFKFTYEHGNCYEHFKIQLFDGYKLNDIGVLRDLNEKTHSSPYIMNETETKNRVLMLNTKGRKYVETLINGF